MIDKRYWLWLQNCLGIAKPFLEVVDFFGSIEALYNSNYFQKKACPFLTEKNIDSMQTKTLDDFNGIINDCRLNGWSIITYDDDLYPSRLKSIYAPPVVLYVDGDISDFDSYAVLGVVGTRKASPYALKAATVISKGCARCNMAVISGGALGVDSNAHEGALSANGKTYVVLGCGLGTKYLMKNEDLRRRISFNGAVISEFPPYTKATRFTFPVRNRLISGLSDGVLVVEAGEKSGSMITASYAVSQNRDVFAVPSSILDTRFAGTNRLIDDGAIVATSPKRIVNCYKDKYKTIDVSKLASVEELLSDEYAQRDIPAEEDEQITFENIEYHRSERLDKELKSLELKGNDSIVYNALKDRFEDLEIIISRASLDAKLVLISLTMLELQGLAESTVGKRYRKKQS